MSAAEPTGSFSRARLEEVLAEYMERLDRGEAVDQNRFLAEHPEVAQELRSYFQAGEELKQLARGSATSRTAPEHPAVATETLAASPPHLTPRRFGDYELLEEIARGGMGVVWRARQQSLNRIVALKMILAGELASAADVQRFRSEAEAAANLDHPHIVPIHEIGEYDGRPYFSMKLVEGGSLKQHVSRFRDDPRSAARLLATVARAVQHAHQHGLLHRDLKPANILLDAQGRPHVTDFGLAKRGERDSGLTQPGMIVGTPSYMAPEQATGRKGVSTAADIYGLGAILYELLTGQPPFRAESPLETLRQVLEREPQRPRTLNPQADRDLETICLKCLHKEPPQRYASAGVLADDLQNYLAGRPIQARPVGPVERALLWSKRQPALAAMTALLVVVALAGVAGITWQWRQAAAALAQARQAQEQRMRSQADALRTASPESVLYILASLEPFRADVRPLLQELQQRPDVPDHERVRLSLALVAEDPTQLGFLTGKLLEAEPAEFLLVRDALLRVQNHLPPACWQEHTAQLRAVLDDPQASRERVFRAALALAAYEPESEPWRRTRPAVVNELVMANPLHLRVWVEALRPVRRSLLEPLATVFRDRTRSPEERSVAARLLADYAADQPVMLAELVKDADERQYAALAAPLEAHRATMIAHMNEELGKAAPSGSQEAKEDWAKRQANAAVVLLRLGESAAAWPVLRHSDDPRRRTYLIHRLGPMMADPRALSRRLEEETEVSARRALILSLGEFDEKALPQPERDSLPARLLRLYRDDPDPGVHSAAEWVLRRWGHSSQLEPIDRELAAEKPDGRRSWYVNSQGQTLAVLRGPVEFLMGSPPEDRERAGDEPPRRMHIGHSFALATKEVSIEQFQRYSPQHWYNQRFAPETSCPVTSVTWLSAVRYCRWLSEQEGIPEDQMCYPPIPQIKEGMVPYSDYLKRTGYRLPTEAEWEYACRAGAVTSRFFGQSPELLPRYAWYLHTCQDRLWPPGLLKPNDFGLFDTLGNVSEWCQEWVGHYELPGGGWRERDEEDTTAVVTIGRNRVARGAGFVHYPNAGRCAVRFGYQPMAFPFLVGIRVARTLD
jgi:formylglycine-generating enzyme required for sulfatase activity